MACMYLPVSVSKVKGSLSFNYGNYGNFGNSGDFGNVHRVHLLTGLTASHQRAIFFEHLCRSSDRWLFRGDSMQKHFLTSSVLFLTSSVLFLAMGIASAQVTGGGAGSTGAPGTSSSGTTGTTSTGTQTTPNGTSST